jgi:hypothetical protein
MEYPTNALTALNSWIQGAAPDNKVQASQSCKLKREAQTLRLDRNVQMRSNELLICNSDSRCYLHDTYT